MLEVGDQIHLGTVTFDQATVERYLAAVEDEALSRLNREGGTAWVPPMAMAAQFSAAVSQMQLPLEALHTAQELEFFGPVPLGRQITGQARVVGSRQRSDLALIHLELEGRDANNAVVLRGRTTLLWPKEGTE